MPLHLARVLVGFPLLLGLGAGAAQAQGSSDPAGDHGGPPHHHHMQRSAALDGPPAPAILRDSIQLSGKALQQYTQRYESHMASTKASRDSLRASMQAARAAFEKGDRSEARSRREGLEKQWKQLADQDTKFEAGLQDILTKDQQTRYQQLQDKRKQEARDQWRHHHGDRRPPADSAAQNR
ncbi:MAG: hypothetical protein ACJ8AQ_05200 [Gemmatimonadales bacterium]